MKDTVKPEEQYQKDLLELYQQIVEMEKMEIERKRTGMKPEDLEEKCRELFDKAEDGITIVQDRRIRYANSRAAGISGYTAEEITNTLFAHYIHPDELPKVAEIYKQRVAGEDAPAVYETTVMHKDGSKIDISIKAGFTMFEGKPANFAIVNEASHSEDQNRDK